MMSGKCGPGAWLVMLLALLVGMPVLADEVEVGGESSFVPLTRDRPYIHVIHQGRSIKIQRIQDREYELKGYFARTTRQCPPFCIQPELAAPGVQTIGEVELFEFMETELRDGTGVLIDARTAQWHKKGTIPGSVNYSFRLLSKDKGDPDMTAVLREFGARERGDVGFIQRLLESIGWADTQHLTEDWDFTRAKNLVLWCNGPACGQSPRAIRGLRAVGYPADKLFYYRGGMQLWQLWGLTTVVPDA